MYTGMFIVRMAINAVFFFVAAIFMSSLLRIKHLISVCDRQRVLEVNYCLMNLNLVTYAAQAILYFTAFVLAFFADSEFDGEETSKSCRVNMTFDIIYWFLWVSLFTRASMTSYMNVKFSKTLRLANRQFVMIFNQDVQMVMDRLNESRLEEIEE